MDEITLNMLTALTDACEGHLVLNHSGIESATSDENLNITIKMQDGLWLRCTYSKEKRNYEQKVS